MAFQHDVVLRDQSQFCRRCWTFDWSKKLCSVMRLSTRISRSRFASFAVKLLSRRARREDAQFARAFRAARGRADTDTDLRFGARPWAVCAQSYPSVR